MDDVHYTEGVCGDGAAILFDGEPLTVSEILNRLNTIERLQRELAVAREMIASMQAQRNQAAREREEQWQARVKAERERDEARAELEGAKDALAWYRQHVAELAMPVYDESGRFNEAKAEVQDEAYRLLQQDAGRRAALGGEG